MPTESPAADTESTLDTAEPTAGEKAKWDRAGDERLKTAWGSAWGGEGGERDLAVGKDAGVTDGQEDTDTVPHNVPTDDANRLLPHIKTILRGIKTTLQTDNPVINQTINKLNDLDEDKVDFKELSTILKHMKDKAKGGWTTMLKQLHDDDEQGIDLVKILTKHIDKNPNFTDYYYNNMANISIKNEKIDEHIAKHKLEIEYALNDIYIKDNEIEILKLVITGTLLSLLTIAINKFLGFNLPIINIISIIVSIFVFLILIRVIINMNKKKLNFREFNYAKSPKEYGFFDKLSKLLSDLIPSFKLRESESHNSQIIPSGNI